MEKLQQPTQKIQSYYEQQHANKMDNLEEMDKFLEKYYLSNLNQEKNRKFEQTNHKLRN